MAPKKDHNTVCQIPERLKTAVIYELDLGALIAGASYKGEVEDRLKKIILEVKEFERAILFIDEIHLMLDKHGGAAGSSNILKPELARGEITIIGATTQDEFAKYVERDEAFTRRFEIIKVEEPNDSKALLMLQSVIPTHQPRETEQGVPRCVRYVMARGACGQVYDRADGRGLRGDRSG